MRFPHYPFKPAPSPYNDLIVAATGASPHEITTVEVIMREDVFHSTLDWQTAEEFAEGARQAYALFLSDRHYYHAEMQRRHFFFHTLKTEDKIREAEQKLARAMATGKPDRIATCQKKLTDLQQLHVHLSRATSMFESHVRRHLNLDPASQESELQPA